MTKPPKKMPAPKLPKLPISQSLLNIVEKKRSNLFAWRGQFSPELVEVLLKNYAPQNGLVLDPFVGSGTVLIEAARLSMAAFGAEVNPAAIMMAKTYELVNVPLSQRKTMVSGLDSEITQLTSKNLPLFGRGNENTSEDLAASIARLRKKHSGSPYTQGLLDALIVTSDLGNSQRKGCVEDRLQRAWRSLRETVLALPHCDEPISAQHVDARSLPLDKGTVDIVVTSPPYINVFNYHQQYRSSTEMLGWDVLKAARSEIGSNRKHRQNRLLTVIQYCLDLEEVLTEVVRVCKAGAPIIFVVGRESNVRKTSFYNSTIVSRVATEILGLKVHSNQKRWFVNKFGQRIYEDILCFQNHIGPAKTGVTARTIATDALREARDRTPDEVQSDLAQALEKVESIKASPLFVSDRAN